MTDRTYCFRFIEGTLMMDRYQHAEQNERFRQWEAGKGPLTALPASFCYPHSAEWSVSAIQVAAVARQFVTYLQTQTESKLDRLSNTDDTQMRLLMAFLKSRYPCRAK